MNRFVAVFVLALAFELWSLDRAVVAHPPQQPPDNTRFKRCLLDGGLAYGGFRDGQAPGRSSPTVTQIEEDMVFLSHVTRNVRTYSSRGALATIPALAEKLAMRATMGIALGADDAENDEEIESALKLARTGLVRELIVGNEVFTGNLLSKERLVQYLRRVRRDAPADIRISTAELAHHWENNLDLLREVDFVVVHFYPFWGGASIEGAGSGVLGEYRSFQRVIQQAAGGRDVRIVVGETGWPSAGAPISSRAVPAPENQRRFAEEFLAVACDNGIPFFLFSAFDEEWKWREGWTGGDDLPRDRTFTGKYIGSSWGLFQSNGRLKPAFTGLLDQPANGTRRHRDIFVDGQLATYYDIGVDTFGQIRDWLSLAGDSLKMEYPRGQDWGAVFVTVGVPVDMPRPWKDFSEFEMLSVELRGERGGEFVELGVKDYNDPDDGSERKKTIGPLTTEFVRYDIDLREFAHSGFVVPDDLRRLYVVSEFVFSGHTQRTVYARNIRYLSLD